jgi:cytochrome c oxidase cbb3-type subunit III
MKTSFAAALLLVPFLAAPLDARAENPDPAVTQKNFKTYCATCHGADGHGDGPGASALHPKPADFADCDRFAKVSDHQLFEAIEDGGAAVGLSATMPPWRAAFSHTEIQGLVDYVRSFCAKK